MEERDLEVILSYLRVGATISDALDAMAYSAQDRKDFERKYKTEIKQAQAQCRILCLHNIMTEGGQGGAKFILDQLESEKPGKAKNAAKDVFDFEI